MDTTKIQPRATNFAVWSHSAKLRDADDDGDAHILRGID